MEVLAPGASSWRSVSELREARAQAAAVPWAARSHVYAIGGVGQSGARLSSVEQYDVHTDAWFQAPPMLPKLPFRRLRRPT